MATSNNARRTPRPRDIETIRVLLHSGEVARALQVVGDRWSHLLMRDAFLGVRRFEDLRRRTGASRGTLTARLNAMVDSGLLYRSPYGSAPSRLEYRLTEKGLAFYPVALCMWTWENRWGGEFGLPPQLIHTTCGKSLNPSLVCAHCETGIGWRDMVIQAGPRRAQLRRRRPPPRAAARARPRRMAMAWTRRCSTASTRSATAGRPCSSARCSSACIATTTSMPRSASRPTSSPTGCAGCWPRA